MAYRAGSVIVDIIAQADKLRQTFKQAKDSVNEFGNQVSSTDKVTRTLGQTIKTSLAEPKSVIGWVNSFADTVKNVNYVAGKGFISTGKSAKDMAEQMRVAAEKAAQSQDKMAKAVEEAQARVNSASSRVSTTGKDLLSAQQSRQAAEVAAMEANKARAVAQAEDVYQKALKKSEQASNAAYLATLKHMQVNSAASKTAAEEANQRLALARAIEQEAKANLSAIRSANAATIPNVLSKNDPSDQLVRSAMANERKAAAANRQALSDKQAAQASLAQAQAAIAQSAAINTNTQAANKNAQSKHNMAGADRKAQMADLDLIFAAMYAQMAFAGLIMTLDGVIDRGLKARNAMLGLESVVRANGQSVDKAKEVFNSFKKDGLMSDQEIANSMKNLTLVGYSLEDTSELMNRFKDSAAFGRQASLGFGEAIVRTTEGIRLGMSTLSDGAGMAKNLGQILKENGYTEQDLSRISTDAGVRQALFNGILKETAYAAGDAATMAKDLSGSLAAMKTAGNDLSTSVLTALSGLLNSIVLAITPVIRNIKAWVDANPRLTALLITFTTVLLGVATVMLSFQFLFPMFVKGLQQVATILTFLTSPIGLAIAAIITLAVVFVANKDMILEACSELVSVWTNYFQSIWQYMKNFVGDVGNMFGALGKIIVGAMTFDNGKINEGIEELKNGWQAAAGEVSGAFGVLRKSVEQTGDVIMNKLNPIKLFGNAYDKVKSIFDPVAIDLGDKQPRPKLEDNGNGKDKKGSKSSGPSAYQLAMRDYEHRVHMEELVEYDEKMKALAQIAATVEMTADERMDFEEKVHDLIKANTEDEKQYASELMDWQIKTGEKTYQDKIALLDKQIAEEKDRHKKLQLQDQRLATIKQQKQYESDYLDWQITVGEKSLADKLALIERELASEKSKYDRLALLRQKFETESKLNAENAQKEIEKLMGKSTTTKRGNAKYDNVPYGDINKTIKDLQALIDKYEKMGAAGKDAADKAKAALKELQDITHKWVEKFTDGLAEVVTGGQKLSKFFDKMFSDIAMSFIKYQLNRLLGNLLGGIFQGMPWLYSSTGKQHDGGIIPKFHTGGLVGGLEQDERVIVAQTGERVLNRRETKAFDAATKMAGGGKVVNQYNISTMDAASFKEFAYKNKDIFGSAAAADALGGGAMSRAMKIMR